MPGWLNAEVWEECCKTGPEGELRELVEGEFAQIQQDLETLRGEVSRAGEAKIYVPVNLLRLIWNAQVGGWRSLPGRGLMEGRWGEDETLPAARSGVHPAL